MEAKLKALKVPDLKALLTTAGTPAPPKATKADLIARVLASPPALDAYKSQYEPEDAEADPVPEPESTEPSESAEPDSVDPPTTDASPTPAPDAPSEDAPEDPEMKKRRLRAERFGIPLVEPKTQPVKASRGKKAVTEENPEKLTARAARFGTNAAAAKRKPEEDPVDDVEAERRRKRAERFGTGAK